MKLSRLSRVRAWGGVAIALAVWTACAAGAEEPSPGVTEVAEIEQTVLLPDGSAITSRSRIALADAAARLEPESEAERSGYAEFHLYDFARKRFYRVFPEDRIYFDLGFSAPLAIRAFVEGWGPPPPEISVRTIPLTDVLVEGTSARLSLVERRLGRTSWPQYTLVWTATTPRRLPIRVVYWQEGGRTVIVSYRHATTEPLDADRFAVPDGFVNLTPY